MAVDRVSFEIMPTTVTGLIGPNGSGKTTLLNIVNGQYRADGGSVRLGGIQIGGRRPSNLAANGVTRTFQSARVFQTLTARQNMFIPLLHQGKVERREAVGRADELLEFVGLQEMSERIASELSGGQQRLLEFARALVTRPRIVLMDEPFAGVHPEPKALLIRCIRETVRVDGTSFMIVSHEVPDLVSMSDYMVCLVEGKVVATGVPSDVVKNHDVVDGYLGRE